MFEPQFHIKLGRSAFGPNEQCSCLGEQFYEILTTIEKEVSSCSWYGANIQAETNLIWGPFESFETKKIGSTKLLKELAKKTDQFLSGIFVAISSKKLNEDAVSRIELDTEDEDFRPIEIDCVVLEIRAFDTFYFSVFSEKLFLIKKIADFFQVPIEQRKINDREG